MYKKHIQAPSDIIEEDDEDDYDCDGTSMNKLKFESVLSNTARYNEKYEFGLIEEKILYEFTLS